MPDALDLESFLQNGYWQNSRARTPDPRGSTYSHDDPNIVPRNVHSTLFPEEHRPRAPEFTAEKPRRSVVVYPRSTFRSTSVEDESASVAKEHGSTLSAYSDEEAQHPGDQDQYPIISDILHEFNPERRFVYNGPSSTSTSEEDPSQHDAKHSEENTERDSSPRDKERTTDHDDTNECRKYVLVEPKEEGDKPPTKSDNDDRARRPIRERRKSRLEELPTIITDFDRDGREESRQKDIRRSRSATGRETGTNDYFSPRRSSHRLPDESLLSPDVTKHSTKGRDRMYYDYSGPNTPSKARSRTREDERSREKRFPKRLDEPVERSYSAGLVDPRNSETSRNAHRVTKEASMGHDSKDFAVQDKQRQTAERPPKTSRQDSWSSTNRPDRESLRPRSSSFRGKRESEDTRFSSEEEADRRPKPRQRVHSFVREERNGRLATPVELKPSGMRSKVGTPLASPRVSQGELFPDRPDNHERRNSRSATFPVNSGRENQRFESRYRAEDEPPRPPSRNSTTKSARSSAASIVVPVLTAVAAATAAKEPGSPTDRKATGIPASQKPAVQKIIASDSRSDSRSSSLTPSSSTTSRRDWEPPKFDPVRDGVHDENPNSSYRRYSQGHKGSLPDLPECPRMKPQPHHMDWLTLPKCDHFNICPSCFNTAFANTEWRKFFVPPPFRSTDKPLKCDFGTSPWYHIAWLLMHKNQVSDLNMFQGLNNVTKNHQPCSGNREASRVWYTIKDPKTRRSVQNFKMCHHCAKSIEILLPNLTGLFVPVGASGETSSGVCGMRKHNHAGDGRDRFVVLFDQMETTSDLAIASRRAPDVQALADKIRSICMKDECYGSQPVRDRMWYSMRSLPYFTVCEECFDDVVWREVENGYASSVDAEFYRKPQKHESAACQLYSDRMRRYYRDAVRNDDLEYLKNKIERRRQKEQDYFDRCRNIDAEAFAKGWDRARVEDELERARREWRRHE